MFAILLFQSASRSNRISDVVNHLDPYGIGITAIGMGVVFMSLLLLYISFYNVSKLLVKRTKRHLQKQGKMEEIKGKEIEIDASVNAAIALALSLYFQEIHDKESAVLTISKTSRPYSPWSSKIYGLRQLPR